MSDDTTKPKVIPARFTEAREYIGVTCDDVDQAIGWAGGTMARIESGDLAIGPRAVRRLSQIYLRPVGFFTDEWDWQPDAATLRLVEGMSEIDREAILAFTEFLSGAPQPAKPSRVIRDALNEGTVPG